jgi:phage protein D
MAIASRKEPLVPSFAVKLNDKPLANDLALWIVGATVDDSLNTPSMFTLQLISKEDERSTKAWTDDPRLALGAKVEVSMGYGTNLARLIVGDIMSLEPAFTIGGPPTLVVRGYDRRNRLNGARRHRSFQGLTDAGIADQVCEHLVAIKSTDTGITYEQVFQDKSDLEFLRERAEAIGFELVMDDAEGSDGMTMLFRPITNGAAPIATLTLNDDLLEFHPRLALEPKTKVRLFGWDPKIKDAIDVSASADSAPAMAGKHLGLRETAAAIFGEVVETVVHTVENVAEASRLAAGNYYKAVLSDVTGAGTVRGRTDIRAGKVIALDGLGDVFNGNYYVESAEHRYSPRAGYLTDFHVKRNAS